MPKGGKRPGAGRKRAVVRIVPVPRGQAEPLREPPDHLGEKSGQVWRQYAPLAIELGTLRPETAPGFEFLCDITARWAALEARIDEDGWTYEKVTIDGAGQEHTELKRHSLWSTAQAWAQRRHQLLRDYGLLASGVRGAVGGATTPAANPWASLA